MGSINHNPVPKIRIWLCHQKCSPENFVTINEENERVALPRGNIILKRTSRRMMMMEIKLGYPSSSTATRGQVLFFFGETDRHPFT